MSTIKLRKKHLPLDIPSQSVWMVSLQEAAYALPPIMPSGPALALICTTTAGLVLSYVAIGLRVWCRAIWQSKVWGLDDSLAVVGLVSSIPDPLQTSRSRLVTSANPTDNADNDSDIIYRVSVQWRVNATGREDNASEPSSFVFLHPPPPPPHLCLNNNG